MAKPRGFHVLGRRFLGGGLEGALRRCLRRDKGPRAFHVCNVHTLVQGLWDQGLSEAQEKAVALLPDGRALALAARLLGFWEAEGLRGPDLLRLGAARGKGLRHYFYGGAPGVALAVAKRLGAGRSLRLAGVASPPFGPLNSRALKSLAVELGRKRVGLLWVGLGAPKQELAMETLRQAKAPCAMLGVGAAFDFVAGAKPEAPRWMSALALEWLHRLFSEPRRLWKRYLLTNPLFLLLVGLECLGLNPFTLQDWWERVARAACLSLALGAWLHGPRPLALFFLLLPLALGRAWRLWGPR